MDPAPPIDEPSGSKRLPRNVKLFGWASLLNDVASEMIYPLLPKFLLNVLGGSAAWLGVIEGSAESVGSLVKLWSGGRSDRGCGRKRFVVFGYALSNLVQPLIGLILAPWQLFFLRIANRTGKGIRTSPRDAMIVDATPPQIRGRAFGFHRGMDHLGAAVGPLLAAAFLWFCPSDAIEQGMRHLFLLTAIPGAAVVVLLWFGLREPASRDRGAAVPAAQVAMSSADVVFPAERRCATGKTCTTDSPAPQPRLRRVPR